VTLVTFDDIFGGKTWTIRRGIDLLMTSSIKVKRVLASLPSAILRHSFGLRSLLDALVQIFERKSGIKFWMNPW